MSFLNKIGGYFGINGEDEYDETEENYTDDMPFDESEEEKRNKVVNIHATAQLQVILVKPEVFADTKQIADHLNSKKTVVLNLESTTPDVTRRIIDFLGGVAYANGGQLKKVSTNTYIITPYNVNVSGDLLDELESTGVFF